jgi:D-glycero-D-manno-heptose 1,7-bisphosphate phosphatase
VTRAAVFLDRDGTIIHDRHFIASADDVELIPGAAQAIARLNAAALAVVVVTNQSGIARGLLSEADYERVRRRLDLLLAEHGARVDASYHCPHHPEFGGACECRKPGTLLYRQAAEALAIDLTRSWFIGDRMRDVLPVDVLGGRAVLVPSPATPAEDLRAATEQGIVTASLDEAADLVVQSSR